MALPRPLRLRFRVWRGTLATVLALGWCLSAGPAWAAGADGADGDPVRTLRVGWFRDSAPVVTVEGDVITGGLGPELWDLMAAHQGFVVEDVLFDSLPEVVDALRSGAIDVAGAQGPRADLREFATTPGTYFSDPLVLLGLPDSRAISGDLTGLRVSTIPGSPLEEALTLRFPQVEFVPSTSVASGYQDLLDGDLDLYLAPLGVAGYLFRTPGSRRLEPVGGVVQKIPVGPWLRADSPDIAMVRAAVDSLSDTEIALVTLRWTGFDLSEKPAPPAQPAIPLWLVELMAALAAALVIAALFVGVLHRRIQQATQALTDLNSSLEERVGERTAALERANDALARFAGSVAHDLRGPIGVIAGMAELLREGNVPAERQADMLEAMNRSARNIGDMVGTLLDTAVGASVPGGPMTGSQFSTWLHDAMSASLISAGATMTVQAPPGFLDLDGTVLARTAMNLVENALKYAQAPEGTNVEVALADDSERWHLTVDDNGPGIPDHAQEAVFARGYRAVHDDRGSGLGLFEVRQILQRVGGSIFTERSPLGGARFVAVLPALRLPRTPESLSTGAASAG